MPGRPLPPLEPGAYLRWAWKAYNGTGRPLSVAEYAALCRIPVPEARRALVRQAAYTRKRYRLEALGYEPWAPPGGGLGT